MSINPFGSMYGPGVLNDTIVPGYPATKFPVNLPAFWSLPNATTRNFGGATQYVTYPEGYPDWMYQLGRNITDPNHISQWNPMLIGTGINLNGTTTNPALTQAGQDAAYQWGYNLGVQQRIQRAVQGIAGALSSMENSLTNILKSDRLTSAQKAKLQGLLEEVKELKTRIENQLKDKNPTQDDVTAMQREVLDLQKKIGEAADKIRAEVNEGGNAPAGSGSAGAGSGSGSTGSAASDPADLTGTEYENIDPETGRHNSIGEAPSRSEVEQFCSNIYNSVVCSGTNHEVLDATVQGLTAGNIIEVIAQWEKAYGQHTSDGNEGFFAKMFDDVGDDWQSKYIPHMLAALTQRAEALGIYDEISEYVGKVNKGLGRRKCFMSWHDDHQLANDLMAIYEKIKAKETANKTGAQQAIENKKTEHNTEINNRKNEVINEKKNEIANKLKEALNLNETPALSSALKVVTDDNGEFTGYSIELNTQNGKVKVTGCTYQQLALAIENNGLKVEDVLIRKTQA